MNELKSFCKEDDTCLFLILVLLGFLICMFFSRTEGFSGIEDLEKELEEDIKKGIGKEPVDLGMKMQKQEPVNGYGYEIGNKYRLAKMGRQYKGHIFNQLEGKLDRQESGLPMAWSKTHNDYLFVDGASSKFGFDRPVDNDLGIVRPKNSDTEPSNYKGDHAGVEGFTDEMSNSGGIKPASTYSDISSGLATINSEPSLYNKDIASVEINKGQVEDENLKGEFHVVLFYTPWCGHSKRMLPDFDSVVSSHHGQVVNNHKIHVVKVDMEENPEGNKPYKVDVKGFPTTYSFTKKDGKISDGELFEPREKKGIIDEIIKRVNAL